MQKQVVLVLLAVASLVVLGCMPRAGIDAPVLDEERHVSSPLILVQYAESGESAAFYSPVSVPRARLSVNTPELGLKPEAISTLEDGGIRAIHVENQPGGLRFFVNGESYPSVVWDDATRAHLMAMLADRGVDTEQAAGFLGLMLDLGVGLTLAMPSATASDLEISSPTLLDEQTAAELLATARAVQPRQTITITYDENGIVSGPLPPSFAMLGFTHSAFTISPDMIEFVAEQEIERLSIALIDSGLIINANDGDMLYIVWTEEELARLIELLPNFIGGLTGGEGSSMMLGALLFAGDGFSFLSALLGTGLTVELEFDF